MGFLSFHHDRRIPPIEKSSDLKNKNSSAIPEETLYCKNDQTPDFQKFSQKDDPTPCLNMMKIPGGKDNEQLFKLHVPVTMTCGSDTPILDQFGNVKCTFDSPTGKSYVQSMLPAVSTEVKRTCHAKCEGNSKINPGCHSCFAYTDHPGPAKDAKDVYNGWNCDNAITCPGQMKCVATKIDNFRKAEFKCM